MLMVLVKEELLERTIPCRHFALCSGCEVSHRVDCLAQDEDQYIRKLSIHYAKSMEYFKNKLSVLGDAKSNVNEATVVSCVINKQAVFLVEARCLFVKLIESLVSKFHNAKADVLKIENIESMLYFIECDAVELPPFPYISYVFMIKGKIFYYARQPGNAYATECYQESYEEALQRYSKGTSP